MKSFGEWIEQKSITKAIKSTKRLWIICFTAASLWGLLTLMIFNLAQDLTHNAILFWGLVMGTILSMSLAMGLGILWFVLHPLQASFQNQLLSQAKRIEVDKGKLIAAYEALEASFQVLQEEQTRQVQQAYKSGIAESAISLLHNIGNAVTPLVCQLNLLAAHEQLSQIPEYLDKVSQTLQAHLDSGDVQQFLQNDARGQRMLPFLQESINQFRSCLKGQQEHYETVQLHLKHITEMIHLQQSYANFREIKGLTFLPDILHDVLRMLNDAMLKRHIQLFKDIPPNLPPLFLEKNKIVQILLNLLKNALESIDAKKITQPNFQPEIRLVMEVKVESKDKTILMLKITDNGNGASEEVQQQMFQFGFSTKQRGSGFGLYDCANFFRSHGGDMQFHSPGIGLGGEMSLMFDISANSDFATLPLQQLDLPQKPSEQII